MELDHICKIQTSIGWGTVAHPISGKGFLKHDAVIPQALWYTKNQYRKACL